MAPLSFSHNRNKMGFTQTSTIEKLGMYHESHGKVVVFTMGHYELPQASMCSL